MANTVALQAGEKMMHVFRADAAFAVDVRAMTEEFCRAWHISEKRCSRASVIADELYMNAVNYGSARAEDTVLFAIRKETNTLCITAEDRGTGKKISPEELRSKIESIRSTIQPLDAVGHGLAVIVSGWTSDLQIEKSILGGLKVTAVMPLA